MLERLPLTVLSSVYWEVPVLASFRYLSGRKKPWVERAPH